MASINLRWTLQLFCKIFPWYFGRSWHLRQFGWELCGRDVRTAFHFHKREGDANLYFCKREMGDGAKRAMAMHNGCGFERPLHCCCAVDVVAQGVGFVS